MVVPEKAFFKIKAKVNIFKSIFKVSLYVHDTLLSLGSDLGIESPKVKSEVSTASKF